MRRFCLPSFSVLSELCLAITLILANSLMFYCEDVSSNVVECTSSDVRQILCYLFLQAFDNCLFWMCGERRTMDCLALDFNSPPLYMHEATQECHDCKGFRSLMMYNSAR